MSRLAGSGNGVEAPGFLPRFRVVGGDEPADAELGAADADDDFVLHDKRRHGDRIGELDVRHRDVPKRPAVSRIDRDEMGVERAHEQRVAQYRDAAVVRAAADAGIGRRRVAVEPEYLPVFASSAITSFGRLGHVHDAVDDERVRFPGPEHLILQHPFLFEVLHIAGRDLIERAVAFAVVAATVGEPVCGSAAARSIRSGVTCACAASAADNPKRANSESNVSQRDAHHCPFSERR